MKKIIAVVLLAALAVTVCGCSGNTPSNTSEPQSSVTETASVSPSSAENSQQSSAQESKKASSQKETSKKESSQESSKQASKQSSGETSKVTSKEESKVSSKPESSEPSVQPSEPSSEVIPESSAEPVVIQPESVVVQESSVPAEPSVEPSREEEPVQSSAAESSVPQQNPKKPKTPSNGSPVDASWFDDALFIGDSVTLKLYYYSDNGSLGQAEFLCAGSLGYNNALWDLYHPDNVHPSYNGTKVTVDEGARIINPNKIFIMLGMNDIGLYGVDGAIEGMKELTGRIERNCPDADIYIESVTPMLENMQLRSLNNRTIAEFDQKAEAVCRERGYHYLDVASAVEDEGGNLIYSYCSDPSAMGLHFSNEGCYQWVEYLKNHV